MQLRKKENKSKNVKSRFLIIGSLLFIVIGISIVGFKYYESYNKKQIEKQKIEDFLDEQKNADSSVDLIIEENTNEIVTEKDESNQNTNNYIALLEIPKINLKKGIYPKNSSLNNVNKNVKLLKESDMPDKINGNFILAGHSGNSKVSYFKNLSKLKKDDIAYVYYNGARLMYKLVNSYDIEKTGIADIVRNGQKTTLTLITCKHNTNKQTVFIFELMEDGD